MPICLVILIVILIKGEHFMEWLDSLRGASLAALVIKLVLAVIFGGVIGLERGRKRRPAGFRTHILVAVGYPPPIVHPRHTTLPQEKWEGQSCQA